MGKIITKLPGKALFIGLMVSTLLVLSACGSPAPVGDVTSGGSVNQLPIADAGNDLNVNVGSDINLNGGNSSDPEGKAIGYSWTLSSKPAASNAVLLNATSISPSFVADTDGTYVIQLVVNDGVADSAVDEMVIIAGSTGNLPPIAHAGVNATVKVGASITLDGSNSRDPEGRALTFIWTVLSKPADSNAVLSSAMIINPSFVADAAGTYIIQLVVNDGDTDSAMDEVVITASAQNIRPIANAGDDQIVAAGATIFVDGSASIDPNGDDLRYFWSVIRPDGTRERNISRVVTANYIPATPGDYIFELLVRDNGVGEFKDIDETRITVATRIINLTWPANTDSPAGYAIYAGADAGSANKLVRILQKDAPNWDPASPGIRLGWETVLRAAGLGLDATNVCLAVRAYNGFGLSELSVSSCYTKP